MKQCKITVLETTFNKELADKYAVKGFGKCPLLTEGEVYYADNRKPEGFCDEAWKAIHPFAFLLSHTSDVHLFYHDWIEEPGVVISCCNDGIRPVIFKMESVDEEASMSY